MKFIQRNYQDFKETSINIKQKVSDEESMDNRIIEEEKRDEKMQELE
jgi:hypothetical protein